MVFIRIITVRASTLRFFSLILACLVGLSTLAAVSYGRLSYEDEAAVSYGGIATENDRREFIKAQGYEIADKAVDKVSFSVPKDFDRIISGYNEIQKKQGLDLSKYKKKKLMRYTYQVTNYENYNGVVYANILVKGKKIVGGDICSADTGGFIHGFSKDTVL